MLLILGQPAWGLVIQDHALNFSLQVPGGFQQYPPTGKMVYLFATSDPALGVPEAAVSISRMHGVLTHERMHAEKVPLPDAQIRQETWKGLDIDVVEAIPEMRGTKVVFRSAYIPLKDEAIELSVVTPEG